MKWTRIRVVMMAIVVALGAGTIGATPARAADLGTITVTGTLGSYAYSPLTLSGSVGDTFWVVDATPGPALNVGTTPGLDSGVVSAAGLRCDPLGSQVACERCQSAPGTTLHDHGARTISITYGGCDTRCAHRADPSPGSRGWRSQRSSHRSRTCLSDRVD